MKRPKIDNALALSAINQQFDRRLMMGTMIAIGHVLNKLGHTEIDFEPEDLLQFSSEHTVTHKDGKIVVTAVPHRDQSTLTLPPATK